MRYLALALTALGSLAVANNATTTAEAPTSSTSSSSTTTSSSVPSSSYDGEGGPEPNYAPTSSTSSTTSSTTSTTLPIDPSWQCAEWLPTAVTAGWPADAETLRRLGQVIWAESRCQASADNGGDVGLTQVHWKAHSSWLATELAVVDRAELLDPLTNLAAAWWLYNYAAEHYGCGWQPWYSSGSWCA